ncbi:MAG: BT4734/BF3469 family protein, partial [Bacteroidales bacterium]
MACSTIFSGFNQPVKNLALLIIINNIKDGIYRADIETIRSHIAAGDKEKADQLKKQLPAFTPSATFKDGRKADLLDRYSGYVHLDFDKLTPEQMDNAFLMISQSPYTFACFRSPSGKGLKVFVEVNTGAEYHDTVYKQVQLYYEKELNILCDPKCKDITRLCFVSDDPDLYKNIHNKKFVVTIAESEITPLPLTKFEDIKKPQLPLNKVTTSFQTIFE